MQEQELLEALMHTPEAGLSALMNQYAGLVRAVVRRRLSADVFCSADVEGCVADTFSEFYLELDRYASEKGSIRSYLCVIARNKALDLLRRRYRERNLLPLDEALVRETAEDSLECGLEEAEMRRAVLAAVKEFAEPDREILLRKFYLGESSREIAEKLTLTVSNVDTRTHRAVKMLQRKLKEWRESP